MGEHEHVFNSPKYKCQQTYEKSVNTDYKKYRKITIIISPHILEKGPHQKETNVGVFEENKNMSPPSTVDGTHLVQPLWKRAARFLKYSELPYNPATSLLGI